VRDTQAVFFLELRPKAITQSAEIVIGWRSMLPARKGRLTRFSVLGVGDPKSLPV